MTPDRTLSAKIMAGALAVGGLVMIVWAIGEAVDWIL